jgi:hypothetical protein
MKTILSLVYLVAAPLWAQSSIVFTWGHSPSNAKVWPACSKSVTTMCQTGYTLKDVTIASAPVVISAAITGSALTYTLTPLPAVGTHIYDLFINARGSRGEGVQSAPATVAVSVPSMTFSPPTGFEAKASLSSVVFTWTGNGNVTIPVCKKEVTVACVTTYTLSDITDASMPRVISSGMGNVLTYSLTPLPTVGSHTYRLVISGRDQSGNSKSSAAATATLVVAAAP